MIGMSIQCTLVPEKEDAINNNELVKRKGDNLVLESVCVIFLIDFPSRGEETPTALHWRERREQREQRPSHTLYCGGD